MNKHTTQLRQIENHLLVHGSITSWKAITGYSVTRLSHYIYLLRGREWNIEGIWKHNKHSRWKEYQLKNYPNS